MAPKVRLNMQDVEPEVRQLVYVAGTLVETVGATGLPLKSLIPSPAFHASTCRIAPVVALSIKATFVPSQESTGEPRIGEDVAAVLAL